VLNQIQKLTAGSIERIDRINLSYFSSGSRGYPGVWRVVLADSDRIFEERRGNRRSFARSRALGTSLRILKGDLRADPPLQFPTLFSRIVSFSLRIYLEGLRAPLSFLVSGFSGASVGEVF
jgi:hypothetical protein